MSDAPAYITTPIYYVNDKPHIGHVYTSTLADAWSRYQRMVGRDVFFLTGTDEHGQKVQQSAQDQGITPQELADENAAVFRSIMESLSLSFDHFTRTTDPSHEQQVQACIQKLLDNGDVYMGTFEGWYDPVGEEYLTETKAKEQEYVCTVTGRPLERSSEHNYYFKLSKYQERLEKLFEDHPGFVRPKSRRNEVLGRLREGLLDVPISRTSFTWGVAMPGDQKHVIYVWIDALLNYITGLGLGAPGESLHAQRSKYWPATYHIIGKEILWFHAIIWPAVLMALELPLPNCIYAHSFWVREGRKMSKSLGNFIDLKTINAYREAYGDDMWRYYMVTQGPSGGTDADFVDTKFHEVYTTDLVNTLGNCASRVGAMIGKYFDGALPTESPSGERLTVDGWDFPMIVTEATAAVQVAIDDFDLSGAAETAMGLVRKVDLFINETEPFRLAKDDARRDELGAILYQCAEMIRIAALLLSWLLPEKTAMLLESLGQGPCEHRTDLREWAVWGKLTPGTMVTKTALYPRLDPITVE